MVPLNKIESFTKTFGDKTLKFPAIHIKKRIQLITGANGSGKTTYFKCLSGCIRSDQGFLTSDFSLAVNGEALPSHLQVKSYLELLAAFEGEGSQLMNLIQHFDITPFMHKRIGTLSTGMAQRVALAGAFLSRGTPLLLDEPMRGLDPVYKTKLIHWVRDSALTLVITTHDPSAYVALNCEVHAFETAH